MASKLRLGKVQKQMLGYVYRDHLQEKPHHFGIDNPENKQLMALVEKGLLSVANEITGANTYTLTDSGLQLATELFGSNEPDPVQPERMVTNFVTDDSELAQESQDTASAPVCDCGEPLTIREEIERGFCINCAYGYEPPAPVADSKVDSAYPAPLTDAEKQEIVASEKPVIEWHGMDELPMHHFKNALQRVGFITWRDRLPLSDINGHALKGAQKARRRDLKAVHGRIHMNMQKRTTAKPTAPKTPQRETVMEIVSHIHTPLTGQTRRVA